MKRVRVNVSEVGSYPENSIDEDSKNTKKSTAPVTYLLNPLRPLWDIRPPQTASTSAYP